MPSQAPRRPTPAEVQAARGRTIRDVIGNDLDVLFCGINPGLYTAATGHHFARPGNRFWPALHDAGFTPRRLFPWEQQELLELGCGATNLVQRATATAAELREDELREGAQRLARKIRRYQPRVVAIVGLGAYRVAFNRPRATLGLQPETLAGAKVWVLPNTSGLNANHHAKDFAKAFGKLRAFTMQGRGQRAEGKGEEKGERRKVRGER